MHEFVVPRSMPMVLPMLSRGSFSAYYELRSKILATL
jgi:hypothetical protein